MIKAKKGFSLAELLAVAAIAIVITAVTIPSFSYFISQQALKNEAQRLNDVIRKTQSLVITTQERYYLQFFQNENQYEVKDKNDAVMEEYQLDKKIAFDQINITDHKVGFTSLGIPDNYGTIIIKNDYQKTRTVEIAPAGFVKVY